VLRFPIADLGVGTFGQVVTVHLDTPLINVLEMLHGRHISAVPVVDDHGTLLRGW
jgi:CBS domain-containing protein